MIGQNLFSRKKVRKNIINVSSAEFSQKVVKINKSSGTYEILILGSNYLNCPKISYTNFSDKVAYSNSADQDQTEAAV